MPTRPLSAHLFDVYPTAEGMAIWLLADDGARLRCLHPWMPRLYYAGNRTALEQARALLGRLREATTIRHTMRRDLLRGELDVTEVTIADPMAFPRVVARLARLDGLTFYNCDIPLPQMYLYEHRLFPLGRCAVEATSQGLIQTIAPLESPWEREYTVPPLTVLRLRLDGDPANPNHGRPAALHVGVDGEESTLLGETPADLLQGLDRWLRRYDPDIILTEWGDSFLFPQLRRLMQVCGRPLPLNRDRGVGMRTRRPRSYMTYGQVVYTAGGSYLQGRWHLDTANSFTYEEAEMPGLLELARLARMPVQHTARTSVGTAITSMQLDHAYQNGILIPWRKARPEAFKTGSELLVTDRGGLTYTPLVGAYDQVGELDFAAMYPAMMSRFNISQETVNCACCRDDPAARVPGSPHHLCRKRRGLTPQVLERVLERRAYYKLRRAATAGAERHRYNMRQTALKWIGVVCLDGNTRVLHRSEDRWRVAPIRELVTALLPGDTVGIKPVDDLTVIGIDRHLCPCMMPVRNVIKMPAPSAMIRVRLDRGRELLMTPDHLCYVLGDGRLQIKRADRLTGDDWIPTATPGEGPAGARAVRVPRIDRAEVIPRQLVSLARGRSTRRLPRFGAWLPEPPPSILRSALGYARVGLVERIAYAEPFVYCFEVGGDPPAFFIEGDVLTHNCFGYQGYKNARFGQIEAHECTTALGRETLLRAKDVAESQGYTMLHALVDSVWLRRPGATRADYEALAHAIVDATGLPIAVEGVYRWIAFVPSRTHPLVGVPNRYFGVFEGGAEKVRGLELRRGDTPPIVAAMQRRMLDLLFQAKTLDEARARLPEIAAMLEEQCIRLRQHEVRAEELVIRTVLSQEPREYERGIPQAVAAHHLLQAGVPLHPGEAIEYIITHAAAKIPGDRAVPYARLPADWGYDVERYAQMLRRAMETLLAPFRRGGAAPHNPRQPVRG
ncbi:MAG TPA: DNA polymerase domain-containing protein [bacterium]|nr:DNA polymerase domain-containing protein [bacterium]